MLVLFAAVAAFAVTQRNEASRLAQELTESAAPRSLAAASVFARDDPELAMLLALQSLDASAAADIPAVVEAEQALHWAIQAARVPYPPTDAPVEVRIGPDGPTGIFRLPLVQLVDVARGHLSRTFTTEECTQYAIETCRDQTAGSGWPAIPEEPVRPPLPAQDGRPLAGTRITLTDSVGPDFGLGDELARFAERTGIEVDVSTQPTAEAVASGDPPDLADDGAGVVADYARHGELIDLSSFLDPAEARRQVGDYLVDAASVGSGYFGVPTGVDLKALVWYPVPEFEEAGYMIPETWDDLIALSRRMVADGRTPWCLGLESAPANGWLATDWVEALVLRLGGVDLYDRWAEGEIPFDHPVIGQAVAMFGQVAFGDGFVRGGSDSISRLHFASVGDPMFSDPPGCWLNLQGTYLPAFLPPSVAAGVDVDYFVMPPIDPGADKPVFGGGGFTMAFRDRPEVREFLRGLMSPEWGTLMAANPNGQFLSANRDFDVSRCRAAELEEAVNAMRERLCTDARDAVAAGQWRLDASDHMPPEIGSLSETGSPGAFWQGMIDYVDHGPDNIDQVLANIEAAWPP